MAIPDYQTLMLPVLQTSASGEVSVRDAIERLAKEFKLTDDERIELLSSGKQTVFANRVHWAKTYLAKAGLVQMTRRGHFVVTDRGRAILTQRPNRIDNSVLAQFEEFRQFRATCLSETSKDTPPKVALARLDAATPEERVEQASREIEEGLRDELLDRIVKAPPAFFEKLVVDLLFAMGYGGAGADSGKRIGRSHDGGIDGVINEDALGLDIVYIQAKRYALGNWVWTRYASSPARWRSVARRRGC